MSYQSSVYSPERFSALLSIADAFIPALTGPEVELARKEIDGRVTNPDWEKVTRFLQQSSTDCEPFRRFLDATLLRLPVKARNDLGGLLDLLARGGILQLPLTGTWTPYTQLERPQREKILQSWANSRFGFFQTLYENMKKILLIAYLRTSGPIHSAMGYPVLDPMRNDQERYGRKKFPSFDFLDASKPENSTIEADVVIVGSGSGGGVVAARLAKEFGEALKIVIVEKGIFVPQCELPVKETEATKLYDGDLGIFSTADENGVVFSASTWGGGTTVNFSGSFEMPIQTRKEWEDYYGLEFVTSPEFQACYDRVSGRMGVSTKNIRHSAANQALRDGAERLGWKVADIPQNTGGHEHNCGYCGYGCRYGEKQGGTVSWLADAHQAGALCLQGCKVDKVILENSTVAGIEATVNETTKLKIMAKHVVSCGGPIGTPCLLQKSGLNAFPIGEKLRLQPSILVIGVYEHREMKPWEGAIMTTNVYEHEDLDATGYGVKIMNFFFPPGINLYMLPWKSAVQWRSDILRYKHMANTMVIVRDRDSAGTVHVDPNTDKPVISYQLEDQEQYALLKGVVAATKIHLEAGADEVQPLYGLGLCNVRAYRVDPTEARQHGGATKTPSFLEYVRYLEGLGVGKKFGAAHPQGSCRMGDSPRSSAVDLSGQVWGTKGLWVADASLMPTATGVNPMLTVMALADWVASKMVETLKIK